MADKGTATMQVDEPLKPGIQKLSLSEDATDLAQDIANLSPTTKQNLGILLLSISKGEAQIITDKDGRVQIKYTQSGKHKWDASNANVIAQPKSDQDKKEKVDACLELIGYLKTEKPPSGVLLDPLKISLSRNKEYRLGFEYEETGSILGRGNSAGDIVVVKDRGTEQEHAIKRIMLSCFREEEVRCWIDLSATSYVPDLYLFKNENQRVTLHMEILNSVKTVSSIKDEHMSVFFQDEKSMSLVKPFSLLVLDGLLEAVTALHDRGWVHLDLHGGNMMVQKVSDEKFKLKMCDFGNAKRYEDNHGQGFQKDIREVVRLFSCLYTGLEFDDLRDMHRNWQKKINERTKEMGMSKEDRLELFCLLGEAMKIDHPSDVRRYRELVKKILNKAMGDANTEKEIHQRIVALLFPEDFKPVHTADTTSLIGEGMGKSEFNADQTSASKPSSQLHLSRFILPVSNNASNSRDDSQQDECNVSGTYSSILLRPDEPTSKENALELRVQLVNAQPTAAPRSSSALQMSAPLSARSKLPGRGSLSQNTEPLSMALQMSAPLSAWSKLPGHGSLSQNTEPLSTALQRSAPLSAWSKLPGQGSLSQNTEPLSTQSPVERSLQSSLGVLTGGENHNEEPELDNTLGEDSSTQSIENEEKTASQGKSISEKNAQSHRSLPASLKVLDRSSPMMESSLEEKVSQAGQEGCETQLKDNQFKTQLNATEATKLKDVRKWASEPAINTADIIFEIDKASDMEKGRKNKSDSEIYDESSARRSKQDPEKYKKIHLDEKYRFPTQHQSQLMDIQHNTEQLLKKKSMLDKEEQCVYQLEKEAPKMWDHKDAKKEELSLAATKQDFTDKLFSEKENSPTKDCKKTVSMTQDRDSTSISENTSTSTAHDESQFISIVEHKGGMSGELPGGAAQTK